MEEAPINPNSTWKFQGKRIWIFVMCCLCQLLVLFQRAAPGIMSADIAKSYNVSVAELALFTSVAFYPCAIAQPIAGMLSDIMEAGLLIGTCSLISAIGGLICGLSNTLTIGCVGRLLFGIGSGFMYVPFCRIAANWWKHEQFSRVVGAFMAISGCGTLLGQTPLALLVRVLGWRWGFYIAALTGALAGIVVLFTVRADPRECGYDPVNRNIEERGFGLPVDGKVRMRDRCRLLGVNIKHVLSNRNFFIAAAWYFFVAGPHYSLVTMWGSPFLKDVYGWTSVKAGNAMMAMVVCGLAAGFLNPLLSDILKTRKWVVFWFMFIGIGSMIPFIVCPLKLTFAWVVVLYVAMSVFSSALGVCVTTLMREHYMASAAATCAGCLNMFTYVAAAIVQPVTGEVLKRYGKNDTGGYKEIGYRYGLWLMMDIGLVLAQILWIFIKDSEIRVESKDEALYEPIPDPSSIMDMDGSYVE